MSSNNFSCSEADEEERKGQFNEFYSSYLPLKSIQRGLAPSIIL